MSHFSLVYLLTAVSFFLFGLHMTEEGLRQVAGDQLRAKLGRMTQHRMVGFGLGLIMTMIFQSSTATTSMLVGLTSIGVLSLRQAFPVILGADVGTTLLVLVLASVVQFDATALSLSILLCGFIATFLERRGRRMFFAEALLGFGFIFYGLTLMNSASAPLRDSPLARELLSVVAGNRFSALLLAAVFTGLIQSSAAMVGIIFSFATAGVITASEAVPFILGANIGSTVGPLMASLSAHTEGKRLAYLHMATKIMGVLLFLPFTDVIGAWVIGNVPEPAYRVAAIHILFNVMLALIFLPLVSFAVRVIQRAVRHDETEQNFGPKYLDPAALESPTVAFANVFREILRMAEITQEMCAAALVPFEESGHETIARLDEMDDQVDRLDKEIKFYLAKIAQSKLTDEQARRELELLMLTHNLEQVGDVVCKDLLKLAEKKKRKGASFSQEGWEEIKEFHREILVNFRLAVTSFATGNMELGQKVVSHKRIVAQLEQDLSQKHFMRLHQGYRESIETSSLHLDILSNLRRIHSIICKMAYPVLDRRAS